MIDINLIVQMFSLFSGWLNKNDSQLESHSRYNLPETKRIMSFDNGKLFKGHSGGLHKLGDNILELVNCYWTNVVIQSFNISENTTERRYHMDTGENPKYVRDIIDKAKHNHYRFILNDNVEVNLYDWSLQITKKTKLKGLNFQGHWDNINDLRELRKYVRGIKHNLKRNPDILQCRGELDSNNCYVIKGFKTL